MHPNRSRHALGHLIREQKHNNNYVLDHWGGKERQAALEYCSSSVKRSKELDLWSSRVRHAQEQAQQANSRLEESILEVQNLQDELVSERTELGRLRGEAQPVPQEREGLDARLEHAKQHNRKLEARLMTLHRTAGYRPGHRAPPELASCEKKVADLREHRNRLKRERDQLFHLSRNQEREARILSRASCVTPSRQGARDVMDILSDDLQGLRARASSQWSEFKSSFPSHTCLKVTVSSLEAELDELRRATSRAREENGKLELLTAELLEVDADIGAGLHCSDMSELAFVVVTLESGLAQLNRDLLENHVARGRESDAIGAERSSLLASCEHAETVEAEGKSHILNLETLEHGLRAELGAQQERHHEQLDHLAATEWEQSELESTFGELAVELRHQGSGPEVQQAAICRASLLQEVQDEETHCRNLEMELASCAQSETELQIELLAERRQVEDDLEAVRVLQYQHRRVADEAAEALRLSHDVVAQTHASAKAVHTREEQARRLEQSYEVMRATMCCRLRSVDEQLRNSEDTFGMTSWEVQAAQTECRGLHVELLNENLRRQARLSLSK